MKQLNDKLIIGSSKKSWMNTSSRGDDSLYFVSDFKKVRIINTLTFRTGYLSILNDALVFICTF